MSLSTNHKASPIAVELLYFLIVCLVSTLVGSQVVPFVAQQVNISDVQGFVQSISDASPPAERAKLKLILLLNQLFTFILPSVVFVWWMHQKQSAHFLKINRFPQQSHFFMGLVWMVLSFPIAQLLLQLNQAIDLPSLAADAEQKAAGLTKVLLTFENPSELWFTLLVVALMPALGEELMFRGIFQNYLSRYNAHIAIWVTAFVFSAMHLQFAGFLPRLFLGGILGYLFYWSGSLWLPIIAHFLNNGLQVVGVYFYNQDVTEANSEAISLPTVSYIFAIIAFLGVTYWFLQHKKPAADHL